MAKKLSHKLFNSTVQCT